MEPAIDFKEVQGFKTWWVWGAVAVLNGLLLYAIVQQIIFNIPFGPKPLPGYVLIMAELFMILVLLFLFSIKLKTRITGTGIYYRFYPFQSRETMIEWHELRNAYIREYDPFYEYGGYGIRFGTKKAGNAIISSASSNKGVQLQFTDGRLLLIGTKRSGEIELIINAVMASGKINRGI